MGGNRPGCGDRDPQSRSLFSLHLPAWYKFPIVLKFLDLIMIQVLATPMQANFLPALHRLSVKSPI